MVHPPMLFAYSVQIDGGLLSRREIEATSPREAAELAVLRHACEGTVVEIRRVFEPPLRHGQRTPEAADVPRINFKHSLYERPLRRQARA